MARYRRVVVLTGAGISVASGLRPFRGPGGVWEGPDGVVPITGELVLSVVLAGQPPLRRMLRRDELEDVAGRLAHIVTLRLLSRDETCAYIKHRMTIAGARTVPFDEDALTAIYEASRGNMRATDTVALKALELAHRAGVKVVDANIVIEARKLVSP